MATADAAASRPRSWRTRARGWLLNGLLLVGVYLAVGAWRERGLPSGPAPELRGVDLDGRPVSLAALRGNAVLVHFWATWCGVCRQELGALNAVHESLDADQRVLSVLADGDDGERVRRFVAEHGIRYPVVLAGERVLRDWGIRAFPTSCFVRPDGEVMSCVSGMTTRWGLRARLGCAR
jgi:thiol-disulfide isomerase/thioredoxin